MNKNNHDLLISLIDCQIFQVGNFKLKSGSYSPIYIDLRRIISFPKVVENLARAMRQKQLEETLKADVICGVPYTALPIASVFSVLFDVPMIMKRKEAKDHGTKKMIEGNFRPDDLCLIIEDIVSSGTSVIETSNALKKEGIKVEECIVVVNRNQGGLENLKNVGIKLHSLFDIDDIFQAYCSKNPVEPNLIKQVECYFKDNKYLPVLIETRAKVTYSERSKLSKHTIAKKLFELMERKQTNLCVAVDTNSSKELLKLADQLGPHICLLKTHVDILNDFSKDMVVKLKELSKSHGFFIMEDRKFADIGNTVKEQFFNGLYKIQSWADIVTVHAIPGNGIVDALKDENCASVIVTEMSSKGALTDDEYKAKAFKIAEDKNDSVIGYVAQKSHPKTNLIHMCPGVNLSASGDSLGQQYRSPEEAIADGADIIIVGRGICKADNIENMAALYKNRGYSAYLKSISN